MAERQPYSPGFWAVDYDPEAALWKDTESELGGFDVDVRAPPDVQAVMPDIRAGIPPGPPGEAAWRMRQAVPSILQQAPQYDRNVAPPVVTGLLEQEESGRIQDQFDAISNWRVNAEHQLQQDILREETDPTSRLQSVSDRGAVGDEGTTMAARGYAMADPFSTPNMDALVEISGRINPAGKFTEEYRVPAHMADPSIAQGPVGWYPEDWYRLSRSDYPFIPSGYGGHYTPRGPEGNPSITYSMGWTGAGRFPEHFEKHERYHEAGHILSNNMDWWKDVKVRGEPLQDILAPDGEWDRELFHAVMYHTSPERWGRLRSLGRYGHKEFFEGEEEGIDQLKKLKELTDAIDEAAGKVVEAFNEGGINNPSKDTGGVHPLGGPHVPWEWGKGAVQRYSAEQGHAHDQTAYYLED